MGPQPGRIRCGTSVLVIVCAISSCSAIREGGGDPYTTVYLSKDEALRKVLPHAARIVPDGITLSRAEREAAEEFLGARLRQHRFDAYLGFDEDGELDGYAFIQEEIGKFKLFTFVVGVEPSGEVRRVALMVYRESRGGEVAHRRFLVQYDGKSASAPFSINRDIINISGATMSVNAMNHGVRKVLAVTEAVYRAHPERVRDVFSRAKAHATEALQTRASAEVDGLRQHRDARLLMGSLCEIEAWGPEPRSLKRACDAAFEEIERVELALSDYREDSELSRVNALAGHWIGVSSLAAVFFLRANEISRASTGAFDLTVGAAIDQLVSPDPTALKDGAADYRKLEVKQSDGAWRARLRLPSMRLDPGGLGKGFAVDRAAAVLRRHEVSRALVNFSGCMYALGAPPRECGWRVAIRDPSRPTEVLGLLHLRDEAVASSGGYAKQLFVGEEVVSHIISPLTGRPVALGRAAAIRARDATLADGWSTAATVLGTEGIALLETDPHVEGLVVTGDASARTSGWRVSQAHTAADDHPPSTTTTTREDTSPPGPFRDVQRMDFRS